jgi:hypothetical protein
MKANVEKMSSDAADDATNKSTLTAICCSVGYLKPSVSQYCERVLALFFCPLFCCQILVITNKIP